MKISILIATLATAINLVPIAQAGDFPTFQRYLIQGDVHSALKILATIPQAALSPKEAISTACVRERFTTQAPTISGPGAPVLAAYRDYWRGLMLGQRNATAAQGRLLAALNKVLPGTGWDRTSIDDATEQAKSFLEAQGLHALTGVTSPYYELMLWVKETQRDYEVHLPEQDVTVSVVFMEDFLSRGWLNYASCNSVGAGGWTAGGKLYAVADDYDVNSEKFRVNYLGHEAQHFADNQRFPNLEQPELEYRAKLTEIILSSDPLATLNAFGRSAQVGRTIPHPHAEFWLVTRMRARLATAVEQDTVRAVARDLLFESTNQARQAGPAMVKRFLPN